MGDVTCPTGKTPYISVERAEAVQAIMEVKYGKPFRTYGCDLCNLYHVTSDPVNRHALPDIDLTGSYWMQ